MAGAKGVGTNVHEILEIASTWPLFLLERASQLVQQYAAIHWRARRLITANEVDCSDWIVQNQLSTLTYQAVYVLELTDWLLLVGRAVLPPAMLRFVADAIDYVVDLRVKTDSYSTVVYKELKMKAKFLDSLPSTTADVVISGPKVLDVLDYKSGKIPVHVIDNDQLLFYAAAAYAAVGSTATQIRMHIVQPGCFEEHSIELAELEEWILRARVADARITAKDLTLRPNDHCTFCPANPHTRGDKAKMLCPVMMEFLYPPRVDEEELFDL